MTAMLRLSSVIILNSKMTRKPRQAIPSQHPVKKMRKGGQDSDSEAKNMIQQEVVCNFCSVLSRCTQRLCITAACIM